MLFKVSEKKIVYSAEPENPKEYTADFDREYSRFAAIYDKAVKLLPCWKTWITSLIPHIEGPRVLESSFGTGFLLMQYADKFETYGIDYNSTMLEVARKNLSRKGIRATLQQADVEALPFEDNYFDTIINTMAFSGYPNGQKAMAEFHRVLKVGGKVLIVDFNYPANRNIFGYLITKFMESAGDTIRDMDLIFHGFPFEFSKEEVGGMGSVHLYIGTKLGNSLDGD